jgi:fluoride ion exporter CrcB/FEX
MKSKANQIYFKQAKIIQDVMSIHYQKINYRKIICATTILGGLNVFSPFSISTISLPIVHQYEPLMLIELESIYMSLISNLTFVDFIIP